MEFVVIVPARLASTRLPNKPLVDLGGVPMVVRVARNAKKSGAARVIVAADDDEIVAACATHGVDAMLTSKAHQSGTDRLGEAARLLALDPRTIVVNVQGDEPLLPPEIVRDVAHLLHSRRRLRDCDCSAYDCRRGRVLQSRCRQGGRRRRIARADVFARSDSLVARCVQREP